jgi:hypothetical protein
MNNVPLRSLVAESVPREGKGGRAALEHQHEIEVVMEPR